MTTSVKKVIFFALRLLIILIALYTIKISTTYAMAFSSKSAVAYLFERIFEVLLFISLFYQVILWTFLEWWEKIFGKWILSFYKLQSVITFLIVLGFTLSMLMFNYFLKHSFDPFFVYVDICALCKTSADYFLTITRINFWLLAIASFASLFRNATPFLKANWKKFQAFYYVAFLFDGVYEYFMGFDFRTKPFFYFAIVAYFLVLAIVMFKKLPELCSTFRNWLKS